MKAQQNEWAKRQVVKIKIRNLIFNIFVIRSADKSQENYFSNKQTF